MLNALKGPKHVKERRRTLGHFRQSDPLAGPTRRPNLDAGGPVANPVLAVQP